MTQHLTSLLDELRWLKKVTEDDTTNVYGRTIEALEALEALATDEDADVGSIKTWIAGLPHDLESRPLVLADLDRIANRLASSTPAEPREASGYCPYCMTADPVAPAEGDEPTENQEILSFHIIALRKQNEELLKTLQAAREYISDGRLQWNGPKDEYILARIDKAMLSQRKAEPDVEGGEA